MNGGFLKVNGKSKNYSFDDFNEITQIAESYYAIGKTLIPAPSVSNSGKLKHGITCVKAYDVGFPLYYCSDGKLYRDTADGVKPYGVPAFSSAPDVFCCIYDGKNTVAAVGKKGAYLLNDSAAFISVPKGAAYTVYKGVLFIAKGNKIIVCGEAAYTGDKINVDAKNFLYPSGGYGAVIGFAVISDELYAVMKRGIVKISVSGEDLDYVIKDCGVAPFKILPETFKSSGNEMYFFGVNGFNKFNGKRVKKVKSGLDKFPVVPCGEAQVSDNLYLLPVSVEGERKIYCFDVVNETDCFINGDYLLSGGKTVSPTTGDLGEITVCKGKRSWQSIPLDFEVSGKKTLYSLTVESDSQVKVRVSGDGVERTFFCGGNLPEARPLIYAEKFTFTVFSDATSPELSKIKSVNVKYRI
ncbi:MAG: hypothetical protein SPL13_05400 [Clostridia bacterium]|nr:hypothetical protein [Clostridia bacterium]